MSSSDLLSRNDGASRTTGQNKTECLTASCLNGCAGQMPSFLLLLQDSHTTHTHTHSHMHTHAHTCACMQACTPTTLRLRNREQRMPISGKSVSKSVEEVQGQWSWGLSELGVRGDPLSLLGNLGPPIPAHWKWQASNSGSKS